MSDLKLFRISNGSAQELKGKSVALEVSLQRLILERSVIQAFDEQPLNCPASHSPTGGTTGGPR